MFFDLDWPTNASSPLSASAELLVGAPVSQRWPSSIDLVHRPYNSCTHWHVTLVCCVAVFALYCLLLVYNIAGHDCSIRLWNLDSKTCVQEITSHRKKFDESIHDVAFHPSKPFIASAGADALAKVFAWCYENAIAVECLWSEHTHTHTHMMHCDCWVSWAALWQTLWYNEAHRTQCAQFLSFHLCCDCDTAVHDGNNVVMYSIIFCRIYNNCTWKYAVVCNWPLLSWSPAELQHMFVANITALDIVKQFSLYI